MPGIQLAGSVRSRVNLAAFPVRAAPRGEVTNLPASSGVWDDPFKGYWGPGSGVRSKRGISPTAAGSRRQASQDEAPWESVEVERIRH